MHAALNENSVVRCDFVFASSLRLQQATYVVSPSQCAAAVFGARILQGWGLRWGRYSARGEMVGGVECFLYLAWYWKCQKPSVKIFRLQESFGVLGTYLPRWVGAIGRTTIITHN